MNTGAEDDSRSTPILAFSASSARATPAAISASRPASASRTNFVIRSSPSLFVLSQPLHVGRPGERRDPYAAAVVVYRRYLTPAPNRKAAAYGSLRSQGRRNTFHLSGAHIYRPSGTLWSRPMKAPCCFNACCNFSTAMWRGIVLPDSASAAARPAASPIAKQAPDTRAADWPSWVIEAQRPAISRLSMPSGTSMRYGNSLKPRDSGIGGNLKMTSPATC